MARCEQPQRPTDRRVTTSRTVTPATGTPSCPAPSLPAEVAELRAETLRICRGDLGQVAGMEPGPPDETDNAVIRRYACIHFPHKLSPVMRQTLGHPVVVAALTLVIGPDVKAMQSMLFIRGRASRARPGTRTSTSSPPGTGR